MNQHRNLIYVHLYIYVCLLLATLRFTCLSPKMPKNCCDKTMLDCSFCCGQCQEQCKYNWALWDVSNVWRLFGTSHERYLLRLVVLFLSCSCKLKAIINVVIRSQGNGLTDHFLWLRQILNNTFVLELDVASVQLCTWDVHY